jgi:hypothetical protein
MPKVVSAFLSIVWALLLLALPQTAQGAAPDPANQPAVVPLMVTVSVDNVYGFSSQNKTFMVEGTLRVAAAAPVMERWMEAGIDPISLIHLNNMVQPWNSLIEPVSGPLRQGGNIAKDYRFNGSFYSNEIDYRGYPFDILELQLNIAPDPSFPTAIEMPPAIRLEAQKANSSVGPRTNISGYRLASWTYQNTPSGVEMQLRYQPIGRATLVKWLLPLAITMVLMLLTPNLRSSFSGERLAIPPVILLTLVFMQQAYRDSLPALPYLTVLDGLYAFSYLVTLVFFCEFIWCANRIDRLGERHTAQSDRRIEQLETAMQLVSLGGYAVLLLWAQSNR